VLPTTTPILLLPVSPSLSGKLSEIQEIERRHLARELHDEIGQLLTGLRLLLRPDATLPAPHHARMCQAQELVDEILDRVHRVSADLRPADLDQLGLLPALLGLFERFTRATGIRVNFRHSGIETRFAAQTETAAYRIVQEALTNIARHSGAADSVVRLWTNNQTLYLQVEDSGRGFSLDEALASPNSIGLIGMRERALLSGGSIEFESAQGAGTVVAARLPLVAYAG
jgi:signal transduction histidine kinase